MRHRRALLRHVDALCREGVIEKLDLGAKRVRVLRLTKYNSEYIAPAPERLVEVESGLTPTAVVHASDVRG
jgi:hypothetical protein